MSSWDARGSSVVLALLHTSCRISPMKLLLYWGLLFYLFEGQEDTWLLQSGKRSREKRKLSLVSCSNACNGQAWGGLKWRAETSRQGFHTGIPVVWVMTCSSSQSLYLQEGIVRNWSWVVWFGTGILSVILSVTRSKGHENIAFLITLAWILSLHFHSCLPPEWWCLF